jgi:DNA polymerase-3 subunit epsilon
MRLVALDVETTGLDPGSGHRVVEIGCVEIIDGRITNQFYHQHINPKRDIPKEVTRIHGITNEMVANQPEFHAIVKDLLEFIGDDRLIIHNAGFDMRFINHHLRELKIKELEMSRVIDTVLIAKRKFPGSPANLDALCKRYNIDLRGRKLHGALIDSKLLARIYIEMEYGSQDSLFGQNSVAKSNSDSTVTYNLLRDAIIIAPTTKELELHKEFISTLSGEVIWVGYN